MTNVREGSTRQSTTSQSPRGSGPEDSAPDDRGSAGAMTIVDPPLSDPFRAVSAPLVWVSG